MSANLKSILFIIVLCIICSLILTAGNTALHDVQEQNRLLDQQRQVLKAAQLLPEGKTSYGDVRQLYAAHIRPYYLGPGGAIGTDQTLKHMWPVFAAFGDDRHLSAIIMQYTLAGSWGPISGYVGVKSDLNTITGFTVYDQNETAGLGAEISKDWFQNQWQGKKLYDANGKFVSVTVAKGVAAPNRPEYQNTVDGISGATNTGRALGQGLKQALEPLLESLKQADFNEFFR